MKANASNQKISRDEMPFVSVVMPIRNEEPFIANSLGSILNQDYAKDHLEIILIDGMSEDGTREEIQALLQSRQGSVDQPEIKIINNPRKIVSAGLNLAIRQARGEIIVRMDGHSVAGSHYISNAVRTIMDNKEVENVGGTIRAVGRGYLGKSIALAMSSWVGAGNSKFRISKSEQFVDTVPFGTYRKETLLRIGMFDESYVRHQDYELNYRLRKNGGKILLTPKIQTDYYVRNNLKSLWKQYFQYGIGKGKLLRSHPDSLRIHHMAPSLLVIFFVLAPILAFVAPEIRSVLLACFVAYAALLLIAALSLSLSRQRIKHFPVLPLTFFFLHTGYGCGSLIGFFKRPGEFR